MTKRRIFFIGAFPPPVGGQSLVNQKVYSQMEGICEAIKVDTSAGSLDRGIKYHLRRVSRTALACLKLLRYQRAGSAAYISVDSGLGLAYNLLVVSICRIFNIEIFLHFHSFTFIEKYSRLMAALDSSSGARANKVFLCTCMADRYFEKYGQGGRVIISPNAVHYKQSRRATPAKTMISGLTIGLISHLSEQKGLSDFLGLLLACKQMGINVTGVLAGPPVTPEDAAKIAAAQTELGEKLDYRGPIYGADKDKFFAEIDVFVFPTHFRVEAQPLVLIEAMASGTPIISFSRGCIGDDLAGSGAHIIERDLNFVPNALPILKKWLQFPDQFNLAAINSARAFEALVTKSEAGFRDLQDALCDSGRFGHPLNTN